MCWFKTQIIIYLIVTEINLQNRTLINSKFLSYAPTRSNELSIKSLLNLTKTKENIERISDLNQSIYRTRLGRRQLASPLLCLIIQ